MIEKSNKRKPLSQKILLLLARTGRYFLFFIFRFDKWHINALGQRQYAKDIITYINSKPAGKRQCLIEIGCGLGDILRHANFHNRIGFDSDMQAIKVAKLLSRLTFQKIDFHFFNFPASIEGRCDVVLMVNWIHNIPADTLKNKIEEYFNSNLSPNGEIIIDAVHAQGYKYSHSVSYLTSEIQCAVIMLGEYEAGRKVFSIIKKSQ